MANPFVYGEIVPRHRSSIARTELDRLTADLLAGQKIFLISPRRYGKSSLVRRALAAAARGGALTVEVTVSSYSSYVAFLEGYARALLSVETRPTGARAWLRDMLGAVRPEVRVESDEHGGSQLASRSRRSGPKGCVAAGAGGIRAARPHRGGAPSQTRRRARRVPGDWIVRRRQCRACAPRRGPAAAPGRIRVFRVGAQPDGADARPHPPVLQSGSGDAAPEDSRPTGSPTSSRRGFAPRSSVQPRGSVRRLSNLPATSPTTCSVSPTRSGTMSRGGKAWASRICTTR